MTDTPMLDRLARVIAKKMEEDDPGSDYRAGEFCGLARALLLEMREPDAAMVDAGGERDQLGFDPAPAAVWRAMIDAALDCRRF